MKKIIFAILFIFFAGYVGAEDFCSTYPPVWYDGFSFNSAEPSFKNLKNFNATLGGNFAYFNLHGEAIEGQHSVYLPYGTTQITFAIAHHTTVATYLMKIDGIPSETDVDVTTSPLECIQQYEGEDNICPYTGTIYDVEGYKILEDQVIRFCPDFNGPRLLCSSPVTLWQGKTFNAVENTVILLVPDDFWNHHPKGAWLVYNWTGGVGGNAIGIKVDKNAFDSWYDSLSEEEKQFPITCPLDESNNVVTDQNGTNQNNDNEDQNVTSGIELQIKSIEIKSKENRLVITFSAIVADDVLDNKTNCTYTWDFGDGTNDTTTENEITHEYSWNDIPKDSFIEVKVTISDGQEYSQLHDSINIYVTNCKGNVIGITNDSINATLKNANDIIVDLNKLKLLVWIKTQKN